jgi:hypothetical protein
LLLGLAYVSVVFHLARRAGEPGHEPPAVPVRQPTTVD